MRGQRSILAAEGQIQCRGGIRITSRSRVHSLQLKIGDLSGKPRPEGDARQSGDKSLAGRQQAVETTGTSARAETARVPLLIRSTGALFFLCSARRAHRYAPRDIGVSAVVVHELHHGAFESQRVEKNVARVNALQFPVPEFDHPRPSCLEGDADWSVRCADRGPGQGTQAHARDSRYYEVHAGIRVEGRRLE